MKVVVFGATGYLGSHAAEQLKLAGHDVVCLVRAGSDQGFLKSINAVIIEVDFSTDSWRDHIDAGTTVVNCIADTRSHASYAQRKLIEIDLCKKLFEVSRVRKARRFIQLSTVMVYGFDRPSNAINEDYPVAPRYIYNRITADRESRLLRLYKPGETELVILRPSSTVGKRDVSFLPNFITANQRGMFPVVGDGKWAFSCIDARDVGRSIEHLLSVKVEKPEIFLVKGFDLDWLTLKSNLDAYLGKSTRVFKLPKVPMMAFGWMFEKLFPYGSQPPMTRFDMEVLSTNTLFDDSKIRATGFAPKYTLSDSFADVIPAIGVAHA